MATAGKPDGEGADDPAPVKLRVENHLKGHRWTVSSVHFHPAGNMLASASWDRTIRIWDATDGKELRRIDRNQHTAPITCVQWHPNGALLATTSADNTTCLWDASTGARMRTLREHFGWVLSCSFAPDRTKLATASWDKTVRLWDPNTGELISTLRGHTKGVWSASFYPVGHTSALLATGGEDQTARLWDTRSRKVALTLSGGHADAIYDVSWSADGSLIATGSSDRTVTIWDPKMGKILRMLKGHGDTVKKTRFTPAEQDNGVGVLASVGGCSVRLWNPRINTNNLVEEVAIHAAGKEIECVDISNDGNLVATGGRDGDIMVSRIPYVPKVISYDASTRFTHDDWRKREGVGRAADWRAQDARAEAEKLKLKGQVQERKILAGMDRDGDKKKVGQRFDRKASVKNQTPALNADGTPKPKWKIQQEEREAAARPAPVNSQSNESWRPAASEVPAHPLIQNSVPAKVKMTPVPKKIDAADVNALMAARLAKTDAEAEEISPSARLFKPPPARERESGTTQEETMTTLMDPGVDISKKVKLRALDAGSGGNTASGAFANM